MAKISCVPGLIKADEFSHTKTFVVISGST